MPVCCKNVLNLGARSPRQIRSPFGTRAKLIKPSSYSLNLLILRHLSIAEVGETPPDGDSSVRIRLAKKARRTALTFPNVIAS
jgi:hypothetical protein